MFFYSKKDFISYLLNLMSKLQSEMPNLKITQIQIQKTIYIIYAYYLLYRTPICNINFETWRWGPVIYELWKEQTKYKGNNVPLDFDEKLYEKYLELWNNEVRICEVIIRFLMKLKTWDIVKICHEQTPWKKFYKPNRKNLMKDEDIINFHKVSSDNLFSYLNFILIKENLF